MHSRANVTVVVLLPGMDGSGMLFDEFAAALGARTIVVSYPSDRVLSYEQLESFVVERLPSDEPYMILAESFSGPIAISLASRDLAGLKAIVLVCTFARLRRTRAPRLLLSLVPMFPFWRLPVCVGATVLLGRFGSAAIERRLAAAIKDVAPPVWRARLRCVLEVDVTAQLQRIRVPILYLRATEDRVVPAAAAALISSTNESVTIATLEGPHALLQTRPHACAQTVRKFADRTGIVFPELPADVIDGHYGPPPYERS